MARILIIDDSASAILAAKQALGRDGHEVFGLDSLLNLQIVIRDERPDLVVLDLSMPMLSGQEVAKYIKRYQKDQNIPIVVYSGLTRAEVEKQRVALGAAGSVTKVDGPDALRHAVTRALAKKSVFGVDTEPQKAPLKPWERLEMSDG